MSDDPFEPDDGLAGHSWRGEPLYASFNHYQLAMAVGKSQSFVGETADLAALWVLKTSPRNIYKLERQFRTNPDDTYEEIFRWFDGLGIKPGSVEMEEARQALLAVVIEVRGAEEEIDPDSLDPTAKERMPGKSHDEPDTPHG